ncbi:4090_t:CDS:2 [Paraglomus brasilianum]|uniref:Thiamine pyrophosphokinase n=1 Tax=Paraglomus brasilianum TaxID=144538 RepID=A0A9N9CMS4_9GLOM|nr:4090_t:CDS:2 [Paraglomus brasilianum]
MSVFHWDTARFLKSYDRNVDENAPCYVIIVLNQPITMKNNTFEPLWKQSLLKICADGGANRIYDAFVGSNKLSEYIPDYICGDNDSLRDDVREYYLSKGTIIINNPDQDETDLMKCIEVIRSRENDNSKYDVIALGAIGGRFDHSMSNIHYLHKLKDERRIYLLSDVNMTFLLDKGIHHIHCDSEIEGPTCGILPIGISNAIISTTGLRWNLSSACTAFGRMISTSNIIDSDEIIIETNQPLIWTVELKV